MIHLISNFVNFVFFVVRFKKMGLTRDQAWEHLCAWTKGESLRKHALAIEAVMRKAAFRYGNGATDEEKWGIAGLLHDADYEQWPQDHPSRIVAWLQERGEQETAHAISTHYTRWNVPYQNMLDKSLLAYDELAGFVIASCLVRPDGINSLTAQSVRKKLKDKAFAAKVDRQEIAAGADLLGLDILEHIQFVIDSLKPHAAELEIQGRA
jgi:predicted hydrolase (HD superfamily)